MEQEPGVQETSPPPCGACAQPLVGLLWARAPDPPAPDPPAADPPVNGA